MVVVLELQCPGGPLPQRSAQRSSRDRDAGGETALLFCRPGNMTGQTANRLLPRVFPDGKAKLRRLMLWPGDVGVSLRGIVRGTQHPHLYLLAPCPGAIVDCHIHTIVM